MALTEAQKANAEKNRKYWADREAEALKHYIKDEAEYDKKIESIYKNMLDSVQTEINAFYGRYAAKENITMAEAKKRVSAADIAAYERKAKRYVKDKDFSAEANEEMRLYNLMMKVNRLEMLKANIGLELIAGHDELQKFMGQILQGRTEEELARQAGILGKTIKNNAQLAHSIVNASFHNAKFSDRIWMYQDILRADLDKLLQTGLIQGKNPRVLAREIKAKFGASTYNAERLMRTEMARVQTDAQKQSFERNGFDKYMFIVNASCCDICHEVAKRQTKHGVGVYLVEEMMPGDNAPPVHPHCRCSTAAYSDEKEYQEWLDGLTKDSGKKMVAKSTKKATMKVKKDEIVVKMGELETAYGKKHVKAIVKFLQDAPEKLRHVWNDCAESFHVLEPKYRGTKAFYSPSRDGVKLGMADAAKGSSYQTPYQVVFHEYGHHADYVLNRKYGDGNRSKALSETYKDGIFGKTLKQEARAAIEAFAKKNNLEGVDAETAFCKHIKSELTLMQRTDISDMFEPVMSRNNAYPFGVGHGTSYWHGRDNGKEGFAEMYSAEINNPESLEQIKRFFPESYKIFHEILEVSK